MRHRAITARDVERITGQWGPESFEGFVRALMLHLAEERFGAGIKLSFAPRRFEPDSGIDALLDLRMETAPAATRIAESPLRPEPFLRALNVYQVKYARPDRPLRDVASDLAGYLRTTADGSADLPMRAVRAARAHAGDETASVHYVLVTNRALGKHRARLAKALAERIAGTPGATASIVDASDIEHWAMTHGWIRCTYFDESGDLVSLEDALAAHRRRNAWIVPRRFIGRREERAGLEAAVASEDVRLILVTGPAGIGKTRLVLEGLRTWSSRVTWAWHAGAVPSETLRRLDMESTPPILVIDAIDPGALPRWIARGERLSRAKLVLVTEEEVRPSGRRVAVVRVGPLPDEELEQILTASELGLDPFRRSRIVADCGGNPRVLLDLAAFAAGHGDDQREAVEDRLVRRATQGLPDERRRVLEWLSLAGVVRIRPMPHGAARTDADDLAGFLGVAPDVFRTHVDRLLRSGTLAQRGRHVEVVPRALALALARRVATMSRESVLRLLERVERPARCRIISRLAELEVGSRGAADPLWVDLLHRDELFGSLEALLRHLPELRAIARVVPVHAIERLAELLAPEALEGLGDPLLGHLAQQVVPLLESIARNEEAAFDRSVELIVRLGARAPESGSECALEALRRLLSASYPLRQPQPTVLATFERITEGATTRELALLVGAVSRAFSRIAFPIDRDDVTDLRRPPNRTWTLDEYREYADRLLDRLERIARRHRGDEIGRAAAGAWVRIVSSSTPMIGNESAAIQRIGRCARSRPYRLADWLGLLRAACFGLQRVLRQDATPGQARLRQRAERLLGRLLTPADGIVRKILVSMARTEIPPELLPPATGADEEPAAGLARTLLDEPNPPEATETLVRWLAGGGYGARAAIFLRELFFELGRADASRGAVWPALYRHARSGELRAFLAAYLKGRATADPDRAAESLSAALDDTRHEPLSEEAALELVGELRAGPKAIELFRRCTSALHEENRIRVVRRLAGAPLLRELPDEDLRSFLRSCDLQSEDVRAALLELFAMLRHQGRDLAPLRAEIAAVLGRGVPRDRLGSGAPPESLWDDLAADVACTDAERGFSLLAEIARADPPPETIPEQFWRQLTRIDRNRAMRELLRAVSQAPASSERHWALIAALGDVIDLARDLDCLLEFARGSGRSGDRLLLARLLPPRDPHFFEAVERLLDSTQEGAQGIEEVLARKLLDSVGAVGGSLRDAYDELAARLEQRAELSRSARFRSWARRTARRAREAGGVFELYDYDLDDAELSDSAKSVDPAQRRWALRWILRHVPTGRIAEFTSIEAIETELPHLGLSDEERQRWEKILDAWKSST